MNNTTHDQKTVTQPYTPPNDLLKGRTIMVTGAGDGIGKAVALAYAEHGAHVILLGRTVEKLEAVYDVIKSNHFPEAYILPMNLAHCNYEHYIKIAHAVEDQCTHLHGLVHNASILGRLGPIGQYDPLLWMQVMQVNAHAPFLLTRALLPSMRKANHASILFTTSNVGFQGRAHWGAYAVSKFATEGFFQVLADEEKNLSTLRINLINPGRVRTQMRAAAYPAENPEQVTHPNRITAMYLYLMGRDSINITGQRFNAQQ